MRGLGRTLGGEGREGWRAGWKVVVKGREAWPRATSHAGAVAGACWCVVVVCGGSDDDSSGGGWGGGGGVEGSEETHGEVESADIVG